MDFTPLARPFFVARARRTDAWAAQTEVIQRRVLAGLLSAARHTEAGRKGMFGRMLDEADACAAFASVVPLAGYEDIRPDVMRMIAGEADVLWPGKTRRFAQSSGTSGGRSKYIPLPPRNLRRCHYPGAMDAVAHYLRHNPRSCMFAGRAFALGGSFANELPSLPPGTKVGDVSATLISDMNPLAGMFRIPSKQTALTPDWEEKLPKLVEASQLADVTNISGVPSWFLTVIRAVMASRGAGRISDVWPNLEVFFHGGISFEPYRDIYTSITDPEKMHFVETYNASEGFFAVQDLPGSRAMLLLIDSDVFYEFIDLADPSGTPRPAWDLESGHTYEMVVTTSAGLWRYRIGDTVRVETTAPVRIRIAGRTKSFINAFGEELMEDNAAAAVKEACAATGAVVADYTAAPVFATADRKGRHEWVFEWIVPPADEGEFTRVLDASLQRVNSDYAAKRSHSLFLDAPLLTSVAAGTFGKWLASTGNRKLGGQRKVPRLSNDRRVADAVKSL